MKMRIMAAVLAMCVLLCTGCSQKSGKNDRDTKSGAQAVARAQKSAAVISDAVKEKATKTVTGTVQSIVGNEVTLLINASGTGRRTDRADRPQISAEAGEKASELPQRAEFTGGEERKRRQREDDAKSASEETASAERGSKQQTTETCLLPVGMSMGSKDYSSVTAGNTLKIYFGSHPDDGSEIIIAVEVMGGRR